MELANLLPNLRANGSHSDLTIICGSETFKVHRCIVCARSPWLAAACKEGRWKEGTDGVIELKAADDAAETEDDFSCDHPEAVRLWLDYLYLGDYTLGSTPPRADMSPAAPLVDERTDFMTSQLVKKSKKGKIRLPPVAYEDEDYGLVRYESYEDSISAQLSATSLQQQPREVLTMHARVYALAVKYNMPSLKAKATAKMQKALKSSWTKDDFANAIIVAFKSTPESDLGLRDIFVNTLLSKSASLAGEEVIKDACLKIEGLGWELFRQQSRQAEHSRSSAYANWQ